MTSLAVLRGVASLTLAGALAGCHTVGFHPVDRPEVDSTIPARVGLYVEPEITGATYSFRSWASGIANRWTVPYGARLREYSVAYLAAAFQGFSELRTLEMVFDGDALVYIDRADYSVAAQAAHLTIGVEVRDGSGNELFRRDYSSRGWSGTGVVFAGGVFAQKGVTRSSTNDVMKSVLLELIDDLRQEFGVR